MDSNTVRSQLGMLQVDPDATGTWQQLAEASEVLEGDLSRPELLRLLDAARLRHGQRGESDAVAALLRVQARVAAGLPQEAELVFELGRVQTEELFDDAGATSVFQRFLELRPGDPSATAALEEAAGKRQKCAELIQSYLSEAEQAPDDVYASSMLMRASEMEFRFGGETADLNAASERLERAVRLDATNVRAGQLLERIYRKQEKWDEVARVLERMADRGQTEHSRASAGIRLGRLYAKWLEDTERAAQAYERVLRSDPENPEAMEFLSDFYSNESRWDDLVRLYEHQLKHKEANSPERMGDCLQIALIHWRKRENMEDAEPWFDRVRKLEPAHAGALEFYRSYCDTKGDEGKLLEILQNAQRAMPDQAKRAALATEIAELAEGQENAQKAIEQYRSVLRQNPDDENARNALKRLYRQTQGYNALVELLRQELERAAGDEQASRLAILREVASVYREHIKSDTALVSILNQIVQLDEKLDQNDVLEVRELVQLYERLARWRDLLSTQLLLAEITPDVEEKKNLYRAAATRWLNQFSNAQQATDAYAALLKLDPSDVEARERLEELYRKRRAWPELFELYAGEVEASSGERRLSIQQEMARLAAERLQRPADAIALYTAILEVDPGRLSVLDALERIAEKARDFSSWAQALERRVLLLTDLSEKLACLQKLGGVYAEHLKDEARALDTWKRLLELSPGQARALRVLRDAYLASGDYSALESLYASQSDWEGLAEVLSNAADRSKDDALKIDLSYRAARVYAGKLAQPDRAFRSYERILSVDPQDRRAIEALIPLYEAEGKWVRLPALYESLLVLEGDRNAKIELCNKLVEVAGKQLSDKQAAVGYARRGYELAPNDESLLANFEMVSRAAGNFEPFVASLEQQLATMPGAAEPEPQPKRGKKKKKASVGDELEGNRLPSEARRAIERKLAGLYATELSRPEDAVRTFKQLVESDPDDAVASSIFEEFLRREQRWADLRWLLELRVGHARSDADRVAQLLEWAELEERSFSQPEMAIDKFRRVLELEPTNLLALGRLSELLLAAGDAQAAAQVMERHSEELVSDARAERQVALARLYAGPLNQPALALERAEGALGSEIWRTEAVSVLEVLLGKESVRRQVAEVLAEQYRDVGQAQDEVRVLVLLETEAHQPADKLQLLLRISDVYEKRLSSAGRALDVLLRAGREFPAELSVWDRAEDLARIASRPSDLAEVLREVLSFDLEPQLVADLCGRAARLYEDRLGDPIGATPYLQRVLTLNPGDEAAFQRLKDILTAAERWSELESLYDRASAGTENIPRRIEMLIEVALICEDIIENPEKATLYYERILASDPYHELAVEALERLYEKLDRKRPLADLLERRLESAVGDRIIGLKNRLARLKLDLLEPEHAIGHIEDVLAEEPQDFVARELAERMLEIGDLRARAARQLELVYEARHETRALDKMLAIRLEDLRRREALTTDVAELVEERRQLLRRMAELRDEKLHDDESALAALAELVPLEPLDEASRSRLLEVGQRLTAHERVAGVLLAAAKASTLVGVQGEILIQAARLYEAALNDPAKAVDIYRQALALDESDSVLVLRAAHALEVIYARTAAHAKLAGIYRTIIKHESDAGVRSEYLAKLGRLSAVELKDPEAAVGAWQARLEERPDDDDSLVHLDELFVQTERWQNLVDILEQRQQLAEDPAERRELLTRVAEVQRDRLHAVTEAIESYRRLLDTFGASELCLSALEGLFEQSERWEDLSEALEQHLGLAETDTARLVLLTRMGSIKETQLHDREGALDAYRRALSLNADHGPSREALAKLLDSEDAFARREAAQLLYPIYEREGQHENLLRVVEIQVETHDDPAVKLEKLQRAMAIAEGPLTAAPRALGYVQRAVRLATGSADLEAWLVHLERLTQGLSAFQEQVSLLSEIAADVLDGDVQSGIYHKVASVARYALKDVVLAQAYYEKALEQRPDDRSALVELGSLFEQLGENNKLLEVLERRIDAAESDSEQKELLYRKAKLLSVALADAPAAAETYQRILDLALEQPALAELERLYESSERWSDLVELFQRQIDAKTAPVADLRVKRAHVLGRRLGDFAGAFEELEAALEQSAEHQPALRELEYWLSQTKESEQRALAAALLEPIYLRNGAYDDVMRALNARLESAADSDERRALLLRLAKLHEEQKEDYGQALETFARMLSDGLDDEHVVGELERLAKVAGAPDRLAQIYATELEKVTEDDGSTVKLVRRTGALFADLGNTERALSFYRRALEFEPESRELFGHIDALLERSKQPAARVELYRAGLEYRYDATERLSALHTIATLQQAELGLLEEAIETHREALTVDESDAVALAALTLLYRQKSRWDDLASLYEQQAESASGTTGVKFRLALAKLCRNELSDPAGAVDQLEQVMSLEPANAEALAELEGLREQPEQKLRIVEILRPIYAGKDDWRRLIRLNEDRFELSTDVRDQIGVLRETAGLWRERGQDLEKARRTLEEAVRLDPDDAEVRAEYEGLVEQSGGWNALAELYESLADQQPELADKREILATLARAHDQHRDDARAALVAYSRLHLVEPSDLVPLQRIEELAVLLGDWPRLVEVLQAKAQLSHADSERASALRYMGEIRRDMLADRIGASLAYESALELEPDHSFTIDCLIEIYEAAGNAVRLVDLYEQRVQLTDAEDGELRYQLLRSAARAFEKDLAENGRAVEMLERALEVRPLDPEGLAEVQRLYQEEHRFGDLLESLQAEAAAASDPAQRVELRRRMATLLANELQNYDEALTAFADVLEATPGDSATQVAVAAIAASSDLYRQRATEILAPVLRSVGKYTELVAILELSLTVAPEAAERVRSLREIATVLEQSLGKPAEALQTLLRALAEQPEDADLHREIERLCTTREDYLAYADRLEERAQATFDPEVGRDLFARLARVAEEQLEDDGRATSALVRAVEQAGDQPELLLALDGLYERLGRFEDLADILERRTLVENGDAAQAELQYRLGRLQIEAFRAPERGLASLRMALERVSNHVGAVSVLESLTSARDLFEEVAELLEGVYRKSGQTDRLASLYEKRVGFAEQPEERSEMRRNLARVLEEDCRDLAGAQRVLQAGLKDDPADMILIDEVARLAAVTNDWQSAAAAFRDAIEGSTKLDPVRASELWQLLSQWYEQKLGDKREAERALQRALSEEPERDDLLQGLERHQREAGRERDLIATLELRAKLAGEGGRSALLQESVGIARALPEPELAERLLRSLLATDPEDSWGLAELTAVATAAGNFKEALELLVKQSELAVDGDSVRELRRQAASVAQDRLGDVDTATSLYEQLVEADLDDQQSTARLRQLYAQAKSFMQLAGLLERLAERAETPAERSALRLELAKLNRDALAAPEVAIELLRTTLEDEPGQPDAVVLLSELLEAAGRDEDLAELLRSQIEGARRAGEEEGALRFELRLAQICETRLSDPTSAIDVYTAIVARDARHRLALEALVRLHKSQGAPEKSAEFLEKLLDMSEGQQAFELACELGAAKLAQGDDEAAAAALERALALDGPKAALAEQLGGLYEKLGRFSKFAELCASQAEREASPEVRTQLWRKAAQLQLDRCQNPLAAAGLLKQASESSPDDRELLLELCDAYSAGGQEELAILALEKVVASYGGKRAKELAEVHRRLANAYRAQGNIARTLEELDKAFRIEPGNASVLKQLGLVALEADDLKKAQQMFRALLLHKFDAKTPITKAEVFLYLGDIHEKLGEKDKAIQMLERALQTDAKLSQAQTRLDALRAG